MGRLHYAARQGLLKEVEEALAAGESLDEINPRSLTPLQVAAEEGFTKIVRILLDAGADPHLTGSKSSSALHLAAEKGHLSAVIALLDTGVPVDLRDRMGETPAVVSARTNQREMTEYLLGRGADPMAKSH